MQKVTPFLSFDGKAEEASRFYVSLLPGSQIDRITHSPMETQGGAVGTVYQSFIVGDVLSRNRMSFDVPVSEADGAATYRVLVESVDWVMECR